MKKGPTTRACYSDRFWSKVDVQGPDDCWEWSASRNPQGYGQFGIGKFPRRAHRIAWELANDRSVPAGKLILHSCDNPPCCNPRHLRPGTSAENMADARERGRLGLRTGPRPPSTHCHDGHEISGANVALVRGRPRCKQCLQATWREMADRKRARMAAKGLSKRGRPKPS